MDISDIILQRITPHKFDILFQRWNALGHRSEYFPTNGLSRIINPLIFENYIELLCATMESEYSPRISVLAGNRFHKFYVDEFDRSFLDEEYSDVLDTLGEADTNIGHIEVRLRSRNGRNTTLVFAEIKDEVVCYNIRINKIHNDLVQWEGSHTFSENFVSALYDPWGNKNDA